MVSLLITLLSSRVFRDNMELLKSALRNYRKGDEGILPPYFFKADGVYQYTERVVIPLLHRQSKYRDDGDETLKILNIGST